MNSTASSGQHPLRDSLLLGFFMLIVWLPLPIGSNRMLFWSLAEIWLALLLAVWVIQFLRGKRRVPATFIKSWPIYLLLALWCGFVALQIVPLPMSWVAVLSPKSAWVHDLTFHPEATEPWVTLSADPFGTQISLQKSIGYLLLCLVALLLVNSHARLRWAALTLVAAGLLQVAVALLDLAPGDWSAISSVNASFANRNHLAHYLTLCISAGLGLLIASLGNNRRHALGESMRRALDWLFSGKMRLRFALLLMAAVIVLTRSRMGNVAFFGGILTAGIVTLLITRQRKRGVVILLASIVVIDIAIVGSLVGMDQVVERLEATQATNETRDEVARDTLTYWRDFAVFGSGLGSFYVTYPRYKQGDVAEFYRQAHNDYLQFGAETGVIGLALVAGIVLVSLFQSLKTLRHRRDPLAVGIAFSVLMALSATLIHATVEFNLQIFANAGTLVLLLALGSVAAHLPRQRSSDGAVPARSRRHLFLGVAALTALVLYVGWVGSGAVADLIGRGSEKLLTRWSHDGTARPALVEDAIRWQVTATRLAPDSAQAKLLLSRLLWWRQPTGPGQEDVQLIDKNNVHTQVLYVQLAAAQGNPGLANTWVAIATVRHAQRRYDALFQAALLHTRLLAPWEPHVQQAVARIGLAAWNRLDNAAQRSLVVETIRRGLQLQPVPLLSIIERSGQLDMLCRTLSPELFAGRCPADREPDSPARPQ